ncbi:universal stress protein [Maribacter sp. MAR_2009_72]|uniref:universal stress protein n=1 Tax=Maribacter sp. MAR_2009_72 TaxID=1250050 RepID=UPI00119AE4F7|nr:universal stress protein [Maribacter sp. MAR_2009_72]TVZ14764.1 nucleotide-binding universal stress UspA family protein [Maribacter sp. MAR_2009_72]
MQLKNILVATDFSHEAYNALFYTTQLLALEKCTFHIINCYNDQSSSLGSSKGLFISKKELSDLHHLSQEKLTETAHRIVLDTNNTLHEFHTISEKGTLLNVISKTLDNLSIDLIVMGNKGQTGAKELFMGSNTIQIAKTITQCPILAIPKEIAYTPFDDIAFVTDFKKGCTRSTLSMLLTISKIAKAAINVLHIKESEIMTHKQVSNKKLLKLSLAKTPHNFEEVLNYTNKANVIQDFLTSRDIKFLAMAYHRRNFLERLVKEPVIMDLSIYAAVPFLILPLND